jgi:hypothetical protein
VNTDAVVVLGLLILGIAALVGIFMTKTNGFGRFSTSLLLVTLALVIGAVLRAAGLFDGPVFVNILFAVIGFAGGLVTGREPDKHS